MNDSKLFCHDDPRRDKVRHSKFFGVDYLEVAEDHRTLTVTFLGKAPESLVKANIRIDGGRRITDVQLTSDPDIHISDDAEADDWMVLAVNHPGDFSTYTLRITELDGKQPLQGFDPRYAQLDFSFMAACPSDLDCKNEQACPPPSRLGPEINYLAKDYGSFRQLILDRLALTIPEWRERSPADIGVALVEILAYAADQLSYYQDAVATEAYLNTSRQRISARRHARLMDYHLHEGCNARVWVQLRPTSDQVLSRQEFDFYFITRVPHANLSAKPVLHESELDGVDPSAYEVFELIPDSVELIFDRNDIPFYTWDGADCCIPAGATRATLDADADALGLKIGDFLFFEEVIGPQTGVVGDADPTHRHIVRLTNAQKTTDPLNGDRPLIEIEWDHQDALPFPLCLSSLTDAPDCKWLEKVSMAHGNIFLADHGRWRDGMAPGQVPLVESRQQCLCAGTLSDVQQLPGRFQPRLNYGPLTFTQALPTGEPASALLKQDPAQCQPSLILRDSNGRKWTPLPDLLDSRPADTAFVVEVDDESLAHLRFGGGDLGRSPEPSVTFTANYRVGIGRSGHIGAETLAHIVFRNGLVGGLTVRNPFPATGGIDPEPVRQVKQFAPYEFRNQIRRAITPDDYKTLAQAPYEPLIQRAEARFVWSGSWFEVAVAIDPVADVPESNYPALAEEVERHLYGYRRVGHDVKVSIARSVPLDLAISVCVMPDHFRGFVESALLDTFSTGQLADGTRGFFHADNLTLGRGIALSRIITAAQSVEGVLSVTVTRLNRKFDHPAGELESGFLRVQAWEVPRLDNDPSRPENGTLKLTLRGGK